ncbi:class II aldolase/adducin family protein [bacterium]|nr:class II aldolase/adducin family protein [bacterium]
MPESCFEAFVAAAHRIAADRLVVCGSGNLSWQANDTLLLITATNSWMADLGRDTVAVRRIADLESVNGIEPSKEIGFHAAILRDRADVNVVLHFQTPCATTVACLQPEVKDFYVIPEIPCYIGPVAVVPYLDPGSHELAEAVAAAMRGHEMAILRNHGQVTVGKDFNEAIAKAAYFELACEIILRADGNVQLLSERAAAVQRRARAASQGKGSV